MKKLFLILLFLVNCKPVEVLNKDQAQIGVSCNGQLLENYSVVEGRDNDIQFIFHGDVTGVRPVLYFYGPASLTLLPNTANGQDTSLYDLKPMTTYLLKVRFKRPGDAHLLLAWESKNKMIGVKIIYLIWEPGV